MSQIEDVYPLTPTQQGMLFHTLLGESSGVYVTQLVLTSSTAIDLDAFACAWHELMQRHAVLRAGYHWEGLDEPLQVVLDDVPLPIERIDWSALAASEQDRHFQAYLKADRLQGFVLSKAPLQRLALIRRGDGSHTILWSFHHLLLDGWSAAIMWREFSELYQANVKGERARLPFTRPFRDYVAWLRAQDVESAEGFWRNYLLGFTTPTTLAVPRPAQPVEGYRLEGLELSAETSRRLERYARSNRLTLNVLFEAAWAVLLSRYSGQSDVIFGSTVSGRPPGLDGVETMVGMFINTLPMRVRVRPEIAVIRWLTEIQAQSVVRQKYEYSPLFKVQTWSELRAGTPLFQTLVVQQVEMDLNGSASLLAADVGLGSARQAADHPGPDVNGVYPLVEQTNYALNVGFQVGGEKLRVGLLYDGRQFAATTCQRILVHLEMLLEQMTDDRRRVGDLHLLPDGEWRLVVEEWNQTRGEPADDRCVHELFERQVERTPEAIALVCGGQRVTYRELNARANQLAHHLIALGVGPEALVALLVERSVEMVVGVLGILKAGGAYVPLDPMLPGARLDFMLRDSQAAVLLTQPELVGLLPAPAARVVCLDGEWAAIAHESRENPRGRVTPGNLAYVIYTSGTTGTPKGVLVGHGGLSNFIAAQGRYLQLESVVGERVLQFAPLSFDMSVGEIFLALLSGATLYVAPFASIFPGPPLIEFLREHRIGFVALPPSVLGMLAGGEALADLRTVITGGEACPAEVVARWVPGRRLFNVYGPTETTISATAMPCVADGSPPPLGRPLANTQVYILDDDMNPVPLGVTGELYIGGAGVARGYLNQPRLTAAAFVPDPFSPAPGARLYRTGDLGRYRADGNIEFLGRKDDQVKIHGHRIELGEVETVLRRQPTIREAVVVVREEQPGQPRLVAYVVYQPEASRPSISELHEWLSRELPQYMLPAAFVALESLPLTPNGKIDREGLPAPDGTRPELEQAYVAPRTESEGTLARIVAAVLGLERVGVHDNFFELGGDSILGIRVIARACDAGMRVTPLQLFHHPTVAELALVATPAPAVGAEQDFREPLGEVDQQRLSQLLSVHPATEDIYPLSPVQQDMLLRDVVSPGAICMTMGLAAAELDLEQLGRAWDLVVTRHPALRTSFDWDGREAPLQLVQRHASRSIALHDWRELSDDAQNRKLVAYCTAERTTGLLLSEPPLMRFALIRRAHDKWQFVCSFSHAVLDGWSLTRMLMELICDYSGLTNGQEAQSCLPFKDYIAWVRGQDVRSAERYWQTLLAGTPRTELTFDPSSQVARERVQRVESQLLLSRELTQRLHAIARHARFTLSTLIQAAWTLVLSELRDSDDVTFGVEVSGRHAPLRGIDATIGTFSTILPMRARVRKNVPMLAWLVQIKEQLLESARYDYCSPTQIQTWTETWPFESTVNVMNFGMEFLAGGIGFTIESVHLGAGGFLPPLTLEVIPAKRTLLRVGIDDPALTGRGRQVALRLQSILAHIAAKPHQSVADVFASLADGTGSEEALDDGAPAAQTVEHMSLGEWRIV